MEEIPFLPLNNGKFSYFCVDDMKYDEFHRIVMSNGWMKVRQTGSHIIYRKNGKSYPVPYHKGRELGKGLAERMKKEMELC